MPESLKNIILVMSSGGYLVPPSENPGNERLWTETWKRLERFLPGLKGEVFPEADAKGSRGKDKPAEKAPVAATTATTTGEEVVAATAEEEEEEG